MLDGVASSLVSSEEQGTLMGAMSQFRAFASFLLTIPCGSLFSYAAELDMAYRKSHNVDDVYFRGFPFLVFSIFGIIGAYIVWFGFNSIDMNTKSPHKENEAGYYTKLNDGNDVEIADDEDEMLDMAILVGSRSSSFVEMTWDFRKNHSSNLPTIQAFNQNGSKILEMRKMPFGSLKERCGDVHHLTIKEQDAQASFLAMVERRNQLILQLAGDDDIASSSAFQLVEQLVEQEMKEAQHLWDAKNSTGICRRVTNAGKRAWESIGLSPKRQKT